MAIMPGRMITILVGVAVQASAQTKPCTSNASYVFPQRSWERVQPAQAGWAVEELQAAQQYASRIGSQAGMLVENGKVVDSFGPVDRNNSLHSARKSFMSAMYGQAIADGAINVSK